MPTPFDHPFNTPEIDIKTMNGYLSCLVALQRYIEKATEFNPGKRYIDAIDILNKITATNNELQRLTAIALRQILTDPKNN